MSRPLKVARLIAAAAAAVLSFPSAPALAVASVGSDDKVTHFGVHTGGRYELTLPQH